MGPNDLHINQSLLPEFPTYNLTEKLFDVQSEFKILSVQYIYPGDDKKEVDVQVQVVTGHRSKFISKKIEFAISNSDYKNKLKDQELINSLRALKPSDLSLVLDIEGSAPAMISREQIRGIPEGVEVKIHYKQPKSNDKSARLIIEMRVDKFITGFEQTLIFGRVRD